MIDFSKVKTIEIPEGVVKTLSINGKVVWKKEETKPRANAFRFKNVSGKPNTVKLVKSNETESPTVTLQKSNNGVDYTPCDIYTGITLQPGEVVYLKGQNNTLANKDNHNHFTSIGDIESYGSIMDLVDNGTDTTSITTSYQFRGLFSMMNYLKITPELPATTLSEGCYTLMFEGCKNITSIKLPATTLVDNCYADMFLWCEKLNNIEISATTWSNNPTWVNGVSKTGTFTKPTALQIGNGVGQIPKDSVSGIPEGWIVKNVGPKPDVSRRFRFENINGAPNTLKLKKENLQAANVTLQRSNDGINYEPCDIYSGIILQPHEVVYLKGNNNSLEYNNFSSTQPIECHGSVMDLIDGCTDTTIIKSDGCFSGLFKSMKTLQSAPLLPATTLTNACYYSMFMYCENLIQAPELPATNLTSQCYEHMFYSCKALKIAPKLKSTTLAVRCYRSMFEKCTSLAQAPELPATTLVERCYRSMFYDCTSLTTAPKIPATKYANQWGMHMFCGCSKLNHIEVNFTSWKTTDASDWTLHVPPTGTFIKPKELVVWDGTGTQPTGSIPLNNTSGIPTGWKVVDKEELDKRFRFYNPGDEVNHLKLQKDGWYSGAYAPTLNVEESADGVNYQSVDLYKGVDLKPHETIYLRGVNKSNAFFVGGDIEDYYNKFVSTKPIECYGSIMDMFDGGTETKIIKETSQMYRMFNGMTTLLTAPELPATTLSGSCYKYMFQGCTSLTTPPALPATTLSSSCYYGMFAGCKSLSTMSYLPATILPDRCYADMFYNCTSLKSIQSFKTTSISEWCFSSMFEKCTSLYFGSYDEILPTTNLKVGCYYKMFAGCTSIYGIYLEFTGSVPEYSLTDMLNGCTKLDHIRLKTNKWNAENSKNWVLNVSKDGYFYKPNTTTIPTGVDGIPTGWKVVDI